jgi:hypothetical protein
LHRNLWDRGFDFLKHNCDHKINPWKASFPIEI